MDIVRYPFVYCIKICFNWNEIVNNLLPLSCTFNFLCALIYLWVVDRIDHCVEFNIYRLELSSLFIAHNIKVLLLNAASCLSSF